VTVLEPLVEAVGVFVDVAERLEDPVKDADWVRLGDSDGFGGRVRVGEPLRDLKGVAEVEADLVAEIDRVVVAELEGDFEEVLDPVSERVTRILGDPEGEPETDLVLTGEPDTDRVIIEDRVPEALLETVVDPVGERDCVVEPVAVFEAELVLVPEGLPETDFVGFVVVLVDIVTVAERLALEEIEPLTEGDSEREDLFDAVLLTVGVPERLLEAERDTETDAEDNLEADVDGVTDCDENRDCVAIPLTELLGVEKRLRVG
jgi:hypothetical protein